MLIEFTFSCRPSWNGRKVLLSEILAFSSSSPQTACVAIAPSLPKHPSFPFWWPPPPPPVLPSHSSLFPPKAVCRHIPPSEGRRPGFKDGLCPAAPVPHVRSDCKRDAAGYRRYSKPCIIGQKIKLKNESDMTALRAKDSSRVKSKFEV